MERHLRRLKGNKYPGKPTNSSQIKQYYEDENTRAVFGFNLSKTHPFYIETVEFELYEQNLSFTLFASHQIISFIETHIPPDQRRYLIDGTFDVCPTVYYQLLIITIEFKNDVGFV